MKRHRKKNGKKENGLGLKNEAEFWMKLKKSTTKWNVEAGVNWVS